MHKLGLHESGVYRQCCLLSLDQNPCVIPHDMSQALDTSTSSETDDPMGLRHLFEEPPPGDMESSSSATAAADTPTANPPWAEVLQLSIRCLTQWMHPSNHSLVGLQAQHLDAIIHLLAQGDQMPRAPASTSQAANHSSDAGASRSTHSGQGSWASLFIALRDVLVQLVQADEFSWARDYILRSTLVEPKTELMFKGNMASVMCLAATCLISGVQSCSARGEDCQFVVDLWVDLVGTLFSTDMTEAGFIHRKASSRYDSNALLCWLLLQRCTG